MLSQNEFELRCELNIVSSYLGMHSQALLQQCCTKATTGKVAKPGAKLSLVAEEDLEGEPGP